MNLSTFVYRKALNSTRLMTRFWGYVRNLLIKSMNDPECSMDIHGKTLKLPLSHALPYYLNSFPYYDRLPRRLSDFVHEKHGFLKCIDVGANIGDTVAAFYKSQNDKFLAIEPNPKFNQYLQKNFRDDGNIKILDFFCSSSSIAQKYEISEHSGTASINSSIDGFFMRAETLDNIVAANPAFADFNLLKIDTDGHDFDVIDGASKIIKNNFPIVFFECYESVNPSYIEECLKTLSSLRESGYNSFIVYDNYGFLIGLYSLCKTQAFQNLLFYQLTSPFAYFDILVMSDDDISKFLPLEQNYFIKQMPNGNLRRTAQSAAVVGID